MLRFQSTTEGGLPVIPLKDKLHRFQDILANICSRKKHLD